ncbi:MAG: hypothetical protein M3N53_00005 [Actinomycetota bacterium]|nr:hypothetical protein [Actinomycetota bacterium]
MDMGNAGIFFFLLGPALFLLLLGGLLWLLDKDARHDPVAGRAARGLIKAGGVLLLLIFGFMALALGVSRLG